MLFFSHVAPLLLNSAVVTGSFSDAFTARNKSYFYIWHPGPIIKIDTTRQATRCRANVFFFGVRLGLPLENLNCSLWREHSATHASFILQEIWSGRVLNLMEIVIEFERCQTKGLKQLPVIYYTPERGTRNFWWLNLCDERGWNSEDCRSISDEQTNKILIKSQGVGEAKREEREVKFRKHYDGIDVCYGNNQSGCLLFICFERHHIRFCEFKFLSLKCILF